MNFFRFFDGKVGGGAEWFLPSNLIHFAHRNSKIRDSSTPQSQKSKIKIMSSKQLHYER